jgi:WD40 repeat protein
MSKKWLFICLPLMLNICLLSTAHAYKNIERFKLTQADVKAIIVLWDGYRSQIGIETSDQSVHFLPSGTIGSFLLLTEVQLSPNGKYLAVVSVGEGHPLLDIYRSDEIIATLQGDSLESVLNESILSPQHAVDPFPMTLDSIHWIDKNTLSFMSEIDFLQFDSATKRGKLKENAQSKEWVLNLDNGKITERVR